MGWSRGRATLAGALAAALAGAVLFLAPPASADDVVVRGLGFAPGSPASLVITGCPGIFERSAEPIATYLSDRQQSPAGERSFAYDLAGGNAVAAQFLTSSLSSVSQAGLSLAAGSGASGVAYVGYRAPEDAATNLAWVGRAALDEGAGGWRQVEVTGRVYTWTKYDLSTQAKVESAEAPAGVADFVAAHGGDGPGFYTVGFGCDGRPFTIDALRLGRTAGVTTYDLEGYTSSTAIGGPRHVIDAGQEATVTGTLRDGTGRPLPHGLLILEQRTGSGEFVRVEDGSRTVDGGDPTVHLSPTTHTEYRWRFAGTASVTGSVSASFAVDVATVVTARLVSTPGATEADPATTVATGGAMPAKPGVRATLWRRSGGGPVEVGATQIDKDGTFSIDLPADPKAAWQYFVTVPAAGGNLAGSVDVRPELIR